jgi:nucleoside-diphosphate-sugar epimerase
MILTDSLDDREGDVVKTVVVTGAGGFVGGHLVPELARSGLSVIAVSRDPALGFGLDNVRTVPLPRSATEWTALLQDVDAIVHLAGLAHVSAADEEHDRINHRLVAEIADAAKQSSVEHFVFISSIAAQTGPSAQHVVTEQDDPRPAGAYGVAKLAGEEALKRSGVPFTILRPVVIDGPNAKGNAGMLNRLAGVPLPLPFGALDNRRSTLSIGNFNAAVRTVLFNGNAMGEMFVVADPNAMTVAEIIARARRAQGVTAGSVRVSPVLLKFALQAIGRAALWERVGCPLVVDPSKLQALGWTPERG